MADTQTPTTINLKELFANGFGIVTVFNARLYSLKEGQKYVATTDLDVDHFDTTNTEVLDTLKIANLTMEGPTKTITGGQYANPIIKYGKTMTLEMQDALGRSEAIEALCGGIQEWDTEIKADNLTDDESVELFKSLCTE